MFENMSTPVKLGLALAVVVVGGFAVVRLFGGDGYSARANAQMLTIRCEETGHEWEMQRGRIMDVLYTRELPIDPEVGLPCAENAGRPTGFPADRGVWRAMVAQAEAELQAFAEAG